LVFFTMLRFWARHHGRSSAPGLVATLGTLIAVGGAFLAVVPAEPRDRVLSLAGIASDQSGAYRLALWRDTVRLASSSAWLGFGFGAYEDALPRFKTVAGDFRVERAENDYLEHLADSGAVGAVFLASLMSFLLLSGLRAVQAEAHGSRRGLRAGSLAGGVALGVHSSFDFNLHIPSNALLFVALAVLVPRPPSAASVASDEGGPVGARFRSILPATVLVAAAFVALSVPWAEPRLEPATLTRAAAGAPAGARRTALQERVRAHLRCRPGDPTPWVVLAWLRAPVSCREAEALAGWAVQLDPLNGALRRTAARFY